MRRLVFERGDSVAAVVLNRSSGRLLFTEQLRVPTLNSGPGWLVEVMAGMIDAGETPEAALLRELEEELGFRVEHLEAIANFFVSPGGSSERIWLYYAEVEDSGRVGAGGGLASEQEDIRTVLMTAEEARAALNGQQILDAKSIIGLQWFFARSR